MTSKRSGKQLRFDILIYLQKIERTPAFGSLELGVIANDLEVSREDIKDQVDILES